MLRERYEPKDLFNELKPHIELIGGTLSGDDTQVVHLKNFGQVKVFQLYVQKRHREILYHVFAGNQGD